MRLFEYAHNMQDKTGARYLYYHLISGVDIPLKSQDYIHNIFQSNKGKEFVGFYKVNDDDFRVRIGIWHISPESLRNNNLILKFIRKIAILLQLKIIGNWRNKDINISKGTNWASVTNDL